VELIILNRRDVTIQQQNQREVQEQRALLEHESHCAIRLMEANRA
jgi:hypothetical protein